ncbi:MAG: Wzz/FepE/Etk N-terminal domain-containing protein [Solirubrobacterales bacterium]
MTSDENGQGRSARTPVGEDPLEVGRYVEALRRSRWLIVTIVAIITIVVLAISLALPKNYEATASIVVNSASGLLGSSEPQAAQRELATTATLATTSAVLADAARSVRGETKSSLEKRVSSSVDQNANIIHITVSYKSGQGAATLAYAVAQAFLNQRATIQRTATTSALSALNGQIAALRARGATNPDIASQLSALQTRAAQLEIAGASSGSQLQLVQRPGVPSAASSPRPLRNGVIALFASIFLAVLVALGREQLTPRITSQRELGHLLGLPVLSGIPYIGRRVSARYARAEYETYQTLSAAIRLALPPGSSPHIMLVTSAAHGEGKTTVTTRISRMLARAGHRTLVISGDLRWPKLDDAFDVVGHPGLRELLSNTPVSGIVPAELEHLIVPTHGEGVAARGELDILPAGGRGGDASELLHTAALQSLIGALRDSSYRYILIDSPPILGVADAQMFAQFCDETLLVARLDRLTMSNVIDLREMLDRLGSKPVGLVVIGTRPAESPYYAADSPALSSA